MEEDGYTELELAEMRTAIVLARKGLAILAWIAAGLLACWAIYLCWVAGEVGVLLLIPAFVCTVAGVRIWRSIDPSYLLPKPPTYEDPGAKYGSHDSRDSRC